MLKFTAIVSLMLIGYDCLRRKSMPKPEDIIGLCIVGYMILYYGSTLWAASLSCDSCGSECAAACGTRHFRSCCFNYLRKKRGPDVGRFLSQNHDFKNENIQRQKFPVLLLDDSPDTWSNVMSTDFKFYPYEDTLENRLQTMYDV